MSAQPGAIPAQEHVVHGSHGGDRGFAKLDFE